MDFDFDGLTGLVVGTAAVVVFTWAAVKLLLPFANALAERLRPRSVPPADDRLRAEVRDLTARVAELERQQEHQPALTGGTPPLLQRAEP